MNELMHLANLVKKRNLLEQEIAELIGRPAMIGHIGEYIASKIFHITLEQSASNKGFDGRFSCKPLEGQTVNIKWYSMHEGLLDISTGATPDYYLVLTGPRPNRVMSRRSVRPWTIEFVFLFDAVILIAELVSAGVKMGVATSIRQQRWEQAELYPSGSIPQFELSNEQRSMLKLFGSQICGLSDTENKCLEE